MVDPPVVSPVALEIVVGTDVPIPVVLPSAMVLIVVTSSTLVAEVIPSILVEDASVLLC